MTSCHLGFLRVGRPDCDKARNALAACVQNRAGDLTVGTRENVYLTTCASSIFVVNVDCKRFASSRLPGAQSSRQLRFDVVGALGQRREGISPLLVRLCEEDHARAPTYEYWNIIDRACFRHILITHARGPDSDCADT